MWGSQFKVQGTGEVHERMIERVDEGTAAVIPSLKNWVYFGVAQWSLRVDQAEKSRAMLKQLASELNVIPEFTKLFAE